MIVQIPGTTPVLAEEGVKMNMQLRSEEVKGLPNGVQGQDAFWEPNHKNIKV
jgi:hypothetical protein